MKTCDTCEWWGETVTPRHVCTNETKIGEPREVDERDDNLMFSYSESGYFYAGPKFGCVHHKPKGEATNTCDTCDWWRTVDGGVVCGNRSKIGESMDVDDAADTLVYSYDEDGWFSPGPKFGCVHHKN